LQKSSFLKN